MSTVGQKQLIFKQTTLCLKGLEVLMCSVELSVSDEIHTVTKAIFAACRLK